ncbi:NADH-quinone oxidoreductase subunit G/[NiFe] hydrogenase diaphorase moiety small subunit [Rhizomicrobium palustre]|uniref:NADH-quinone oxidoreductase subunit G/[NiFe] hydrogenase diaphorase moiety small subunit n=1 Tax=Rhizomicrobium palustre TaxID=189966 RepID=A0A846MZR1_9PROT|nr:2Fe-2S iron-sulfur cluster binding domain-containing protein [Rhizomicrobium palustre]NIK88427.1 NADH-quinone oxidoreductase subunit G/[NiFe] hydrogenase diaphorase moiety small subunit [Rhizomicrobium palustre]
MDVETITLTIDGKDISVAPGTTVLEAARIAGIHIPTLCHHDDLCSEALYSQTSESDRPKHEESGMLATPSSCRLCLVEVEGLSKLHASCALPVHGPMTVRTTSAAIRHARRDILELMMSEHYGDCFACARNGTCELQKLCEDYGVTSERFGRPRAPLFDKAAPGNIIMRDMNKCILCRRCVRMCALYQGVYALTTEGRGDHSRISTFMGREMKDAACINCGQCINRCPTGALTERDDTEAVWQAIEDPDKIVVIQTAPAPRAAIGEAFGCEPGTALTYQLNTALRRIGFDKVFDTTFSADLTIMEEGAELLSRLYKGLVLKDNAARLPQFTSCSPGWIKFIEHFYPAYLPNLSSAKSPQQMMGAVIKTYFAEKNGWDPSRIVSVSLMPCTAKKFEAARPEMDSSGFRDVDYALTTREVARMLKQAGIELPKLEGSPFDDPFGVSSGSGVIFGATGGVMEAALRTVVELVTGEKVEYLFDKADIKPVRGFDGVRMAEIPITSVGPVPKLLAHLMPDFDWLKGVTLRVGLAHGTINAMRVLQDVAEGGPLSTCHFIEFMACPGGCLGGGGQPIPTDREIRTARAKALYGEDAHDVVRKSHENADVLRIYREFFTEGPLSRKSHELLHTRYKERV